MLDALGDVLRAVSLDADGRLSWLGRPIARERFAGVLYSRWYVRGGVTPLHERGPASAADAELELRDKLERPHRSRRRSVSLPLLDGARGGHVLDLDGVPVWAATAARAVDRSLRVQVPASLPDALPGFLLVHGASGAVDDSARRIRLYLNLGPGEALEVNRRLAAALDATGASYTYKVLSELAGYPRTDAFVLYAQDLLAADLAAGVLDVLGGLPGPGRGATPPFARRLADGVAVAEDPPERSRSFGQLRCEQLADALLDLFVDGPVAVDAVLGALEARGVDRGRPHLLSSGPDPTDSLARVWSGRGCAARNRIRRGVSPLRAAIAIGDRLLADAISDGRRMTWLERTEGGELLPVAGDLYGGTAGIAIFFGELLAATGESRWRKAAQLSIDHALEAVERVFVDSRGGFHGGWAGIGWAACRLSGRLDCQELSRRGSELVVAALRLPPSRDLIAGTTGAVVAAASLGWSRDPRCGRLVRRAAMKAATARTRHRARGIAHGAAGTVVALAAAGVNPSGVSSRELSTTVRAKVRRQLGMALSSPLPPTWCRGSVGVLAAAISLDVPIPPPLLDHIDATVSADRASAADPCLCHGWCGAAAVAERLVDRDRRADRALARRSLRAGGLDDVSWPDSPGLMVGQAGVGLYLLGCDSLESPIPTLLLCDPCGVTTP